MNDDQTLTDNSTQGSMDDSNLDTNAIMNDDTKSSTHDLGDDIADNAGYTLGTDDTDQ